MKSSQQGFNLIELLVVIALLGILTAVAVPQYQRHVTRTQVTAAHAGLTAYRAAVDAELFSDPAMDSANLLQVLDLAATADAATGKPGLTYADGVVTLTSNPVDTAGTALVLIRNVEGEWRCVNPKNDDFRLLGCTER